MACVGMAALGLLWLAALQLATCAGDTDSDTVRVVRERLSMEQEHKITVDSSIEFILEFVPNEEQSSWPKRLRVTMTSASGGGGDFSRPVLITAHLSTGAQMWQLPYTWLPDNRLLFELERTLCPDHFTDQVEDAACGSPGSVSCGRGAAGGGSLLLHVSSRYGANVTVRVEPARNWLLDYNRETRMRTTKTAPGVMLYRWASAEQTSVRLVAASEDDVCATLVVYNYTCPLPASQKELFRGGTHLTMLHSGALQVSRDQYPLGFYVVGLLEASQRPCEWERPADMSKFLVDLTGRGADLRDRSVHVPPTLHDKNLTLTVLASLTVRQYAVAASATLALFLSFYVAFGALVVVQRWEPLAKFVKPKAVLADTPQATIDCSDNSDSDEEPETTTATSPTTTAFYPTTTTTSPTATDVAVDTFSIESDAAHTARVYGTGESGQLDSNGAQPSASAQTQTPFGLPARLRVAALSRRRARTLRARSDRYLHTLYTVAVFYALPVVQFVATFQIMLNVSGSLDLCYYNFLCAHRAGALSDFNHVFSNIGYLLLGALFLLQLRRRRARRARKPRHEEYGIPAHYGLLESLGAGMMVVALLSASYHVCPNQLNFQFDTAFMYVLAVLSMVKIYQARHPDVNARAHATFGVLAVLIALVVWGVLGGGFLFWVLWTVLHVSTFLLLSLDIYYVGKFKLDKQWVKTKVQDLLSALGAGAGAGAGARPLYSARLVLLLIANAVNWAFAIHGLVTQAADFAGHMLTLLLANTLMHMVFYLTLKLLHGERLRWYAWAFLGGAAAAWGPALYFFEYGSSDWAATPAQSRHANHECKVLRFYDSHDLWHMLSALALYLSFNAMLVWDDGLSAVRRTDIPVF